jgi:hypothetical protein
VWTYDRILDGVVVMNTSFDIDEKGFVFLDVMARPYWCRAWGEDIWLFFWHPDNHWVSLRPVREDEKERLFSMRNLLPVEHQEAYHNTHERWASL